ncbi:MAG TPA: YdeI/OmpD-associated family protein [Bacteroidales bacterium]|nr:YdeI/OmpD-associated family protein [Bacteroidales bacterium]HPT12072.1 YdeI/OmpD-associated family protein [Bacteroidales bacterium]
MIKKGDQPTVIPEELQALLDKNKEEKEFFETLANSYKKGYCDWVGSAKQEATRQLRAEKALIMLKNRQKILKT